MAGKKKIGAKPYVVRFKYSIEEESMLYIGASSPEAAREAAEEMLANDPNARATNPEIISVSEFQRVAPEQSGTSLQ